MSCGRCYDLSEEWQRRCECAPKPKRYFLDQDNDGHWFLVDADKRAEWEEWVKLGPDDETGWRPPEHATELAGGPSNLVFEMPEEIL